MLGLSSNRTNVAFASCGFFLTSRTCVDSAVAVEGNVAIVVNVHVFVVNVVEAAADVPDLRVVEEMSALPTTAVKAGTEVAEAVVNTAIKSYDRAPISRIKNESGTAPAPPAGSPEETDFGGFNPGAGNPEIICSVVVVIPIAGCPEITIARTNRLVVHKQRRWRYGNGNTDAHLSVERTRNCRHQNCQQYRTNYKLQTHLLPPRRSPSLTPILTGCLGLRGFSGVFSTWPSDAGNRRPAHIQQTIAA